MKQKQAFGRKAGGPDKAPLSSEEIEPIKDPANRMLPIISLRELMSVYKRIDRRGNRRLRNSEKAAITKCGRTERESESFSGKKKKIGKPWRGRWEQ